MLKTSTAGKLRWANSDLKKQLASYVAKLHSINRLLGTLTVCNQEVLEASRELLEALRLAKAPAGVARKPGPFPRARFLPSLRAHGAQIFWFAPLDWGGSPT